MKRKKLLAGLLCFAMLATLLPMTAMAEETDASGEYTYYEDFSDSTLTTIETEGVTFQAFDLTSDDSGYWKKEVVTEEGESYLKYTMNAGGTYDSTTDQTFADMQALGLYDGTQAFEVGLKFKTEDNIRLGAQFTDFFTILASKSTDSTPIKTANRTNFNMMQNNNTGGFVLAVRSGVGDYKNKIYNPDGWVSVRAIIDPVNYTVTQNVNFTDISGEEINLTITYQEQGSFKGADGFAIRGTLSAVCNLTQSFMIDDVYSKPVTISDKTVTYMLSEADETAYATSIVIGDKAFLATAPELNSDHAGERFTGWYNADGTKFDAENVTESTTVYAGWSTTLMDEQFDDDKVNVLFAPPISLVEGDTMWQGGVDSGRMKYTYAYNASPATRYNSTYTAPWNSPNTSQAFYSWRFEPRTVAPQLLKQNTEYELNYEIEMSGTADIRMDLLTLNGATNQDQKKIATFSTDSAWYKVTGTNFTYSSIENNEHSSTSEMLIKRTNVAGPINVNVKFNINLDSCTYDETTKKYNDSTDIYGGTATITATYTNTSGEVKTLTGVGTFENTGNNGSWAIDRLQFVELYATGSSTKTDATVYLDNIYLQEVPAKVVTFVTNCDATIEPISTTGTSITLPDEPTRDGYNFMGWYTTEDFEEGTEFDGTGLTDSVTVYANWIEKNEKTVTFDSNGGSEVAAIVTESASIELPDEPTKEGGYKFDGWYYDNGVWENKFDGTGLTGSVTVYAKWLAVTDISTGYYYYEDFSDNEFTMPAGENVSFNGFNMDTTSGWWKKEIETKDGESYLKFTMNAGGTYTAADDQIFAQVTAVDLYEVGDAFEVGFKFKSEDNKWLKASITDMFSIYGAKMNTDGSVYIKNLNNMGLQMRNDANDGLRLAKINASSDYTNKIFYPDGWISVKAIIDTNNKTITEQISYTDTEGKEITKTMHYQETGTFQDVTGFAIMGKLASASSYTQSFMIDDVYSKPVEVSANKVTYMRDAETTHFESIVIDGEAFLPTDPTQEVGYLFDGWYLDTDASGGYSTGDTKFVPENITEDVTVYAKWTDVLVNETFDDEKVNPYLSVYKHADTNAIMWTSAAEDGRGVYYFDPTKTGGTSDFAGLSLPLTQPTGATGLYSWMMRPNNRDQNVLLKQNTEYELGYTIELDSITNVNMELFRPGYSDNTTNPGLPKFSADATWYKIQNVPTNNNSEVANSQASTSEILIRRSAVNGALNVKINYNLNLDAYGEKGEDSTYALVDGALPKYGTATVQVTYTDANTGEIVVAEGSSTFASIRAQGTAHYEMDRLYGTEMSGGGSNAGYLYLDNVYLREVHQDEAAKTITFDTNGGSEVAPITTTNNYITLPDEPTNGSFQFDGWYYDNGTFTQAFTGMGIEASATVYAKWLERYTLTFETGSFTNILGETVSHKEIASQLTTGEVTIPETITSAFGVKFEGWYADAAFTTPFDTSTTTISEDTTIYAKWSGYVYNEDFEGDSYDTMFDAQSVDEGYSQRWASMVETDALTGNKYMKYYMLYNEDGTPVAQDNNSTLFSYAAVNEDSDPAMKLERDTDYEAGFKVDLNNNKSYLSGMIGMTIGGTGNHGHTSLGQIGVSSGNVFFGDGTIESIANIDGYISVYSRFNINGSQDVQGDEDDKNGVETVYVTYTRTDGNTITKTWTKNFVSTKMAHIYVPVDRFHGVSVREYTRSADYVENEEIYIDDVFIKPAASSKITLVTGEYSEDGEWFDDYIENEFVVTDGRVPELPAPYWDDNHTFTGWYLDEACTIKFVNTTISQDTILYARWQVTPNVSAISPADGAENISTSPVITIKFDSEMKAETINYNTIVIMKGDYLLTANDYIIRTYIDAKTNTTVATVTVNAKLDYDTEYTVVVKEGAANNHGAMAADVTSSFTTAPMSLYLENIAIKDTSGNTVGKISTMAGNKINITFNVFDTAE